MREFKTANLACISDLNCQISVWCLNNMLWLFRTIEDIIWYDTLWDQFLTVPISNMRALSCYLKCWESLPKQSDQVITFDQQVKLTFSWWCSRILFAFKSTIVASKVKRQIMNSIRSNVAEYWVDHKYWKHHKAIKRKSSQHPRFISTFYESRTNAKDFKNEGDFQVAMN